MTRIARGLAATAVILALAGTAACGGGNDTTDDPTETTETPTGSQEPGGSVNLFPGKGGGRSAPVRVPTAKVRERKRVPVKVRSDHPDQNISFDLEGAEMDDPDQGDASADLGTCTGTLAPGEECEVYLDVTPYVPGSYGGTLTIDTSQGETLHVPFSGEAVGDGPTQTESPTTPTPLPTDPTETPDITPTDTPTEDSGTETEINP
ncbi:hypothetical protein [Streptomyces sp. NPDC126499]|uniref:hypothetical protein n=1 Tax=Streptomyces sp. NPDC126499 TaxID=3155314 RepID=UPI0033241482